jgi:cytochrome b561
MQKKQLKYSNVAIALHWVTALPLIYMLLWGEGLIKSGSGDTPANPMLHVSLGLSILILSVLRLAWRLMNPPPADVPMPAWQAKFSHMLHWGFYALLILIPLSGMAALDHSIVGKHPEFSTLTYFGLFPMPHFALDWFGQTHDLMTKLAIALLILHVLGALKHQFIDKDNLLKRMSPH